MSFHKEVNNLIEIIKKLSEAPDTELDKEFSELCKETLAKDLSKEELVSFLWDILDCCVRYGAGSSFIVNFLEVILDGYPESEEQKATRRKKLEEAT